MKCYLLDTAPLAAYLLQRETAIQLIRPLIEKHQIATSIVVYAEVTEYTKGLSKFTQRHIDFWPKYKVREILAWDIRASICLISRFRECRSQWRYPPRFL